MYPHNDDKLRQLVNMKMKAQTVLLLFAILKGIFFQVIYFYFWTASYVELYRYINAE